MPATSSTATSTETPGSTWCSTRWRKTCAATRATTTAPIVRPLRRISERQVDRIKRLGAIVSGNPYYTTALADNYSKVASVPNAPTRWCAWATSSEPAFPIRTTPICRWLPGSRFSSCIVESTGPRSPDASRVKTSGQPRGALRAVTIDAAYSLQMEKEVGSIVPGQAGELHHPRRQSRDLRRREDQGHRGLGNGS